MGRCWKWALQGCSALSPCCFRVWHHFLSFISSSSWARPHWPYGICRAAPAWLPSFLAEDAELYSWPFSFLPMHAGWDVVSGLLPARHLSQLHGKPQGNLQHAIAECLLSLPLFVGSALILLIRAAWGGGQGRHFSIQDMKQALHLLPEGNIAGADPKSRSSPLGYVCSNGSWCHSVQLTSEQVTQPGNTARQLLPTSLCPFLTGVSHFLSAPGLAYPRTLSSLVIPLFALLAM